MLIEFSIGNYRSIKEPVTVSMVAAKLRSRNRALDENNLFPIADSVSLLRSAAIYGANASGKSNLIQALAFMRRFVLESSKETQADEPINVESFKLSTETENAPSYFEVVFRLEGKRFRYGFEVDSKRVRSEWLYHVPEVREARLFVRKEDDFAISSVFKEAKGLSDKTRDNALFLSVIAQFNGPVAKSILRWFRGLGVISGLDDIGYRFFTLEKFEDGTFRDDILAIIKRLDFGIDDIAVRSIETTEANIPIGLLAELRKLVAPGAKDELLFPKQVKSLTSIHGKYDHDNSPVALTTFGFDNAESEGTKKLFYLLGPILDTLRSGRVFVVDELDARFHPHITVSIIKLFNSNETNPKNAQLIFATHDTNLLDNRLFRRDQIWFTEKTTFGATDLFSLAEYRVRNDAFFEKEYLAGKYGAIPFVGSLDYILASRDG